MLWLVLDTNVLLEHLQPLRNWHRLARMSVSAGKEHRQIALALRLYVPWKVVSELDGLAKAPGAAAAHTHACVPSSLANMRWVACHESIGGQFAAPADVQRFLLDEAELQTGV